jgi:L-alanine-DL-glutamate epimerase-like enolase superfamily enzyme
VKIRDVETVVVFVRIHTDEGIVGTGEASLEGKSRRSLPPSGS